MSAPIHLKVIIDPQPIEHWDTDPADLQRWEGEGGTPNTQPINQLPADSPVQAGDRLLVTGGRVIREEDTYFYDIRVEKIHDDS